MLLEMPQRKDPKVNRPMADENTRRMPKRSAIPAADRYKHRQAQGVARKHSLHVERGDIERFGNSGTSRVQNRRIKRFHEKGHGHQLR